MSEFRRWLAEVTPQLEARPGNVEVPPLGPANLEGLRTSLERRLARNEIYFRISFAVSVLLALATIVGAFFSKTMGTAWASAAFGVSAAGAVALTLNAVREKQSFDIMLELASGLDEDSVRDVLQVLLRRYPQPAPETQAMRNVPQPRRVQPSKRSV